jgi:hypothetical protein
MRLLSHRISFINHIVRCILVTRQLLMCSRFDNEIYWIVLHVLTTIHYYTFKIAVYMTHKQLEPSQG